ncbi:MAG: hypothetical protein CMH19_06410, partial [Methylophaga sp.]|nr:hypothetical protein [Methylophaga sp.]
MHHLCPRMDCMPARQGGARRPVLLVVYLERLNHTLRALIGAFSVTTEAALKDQQALMFIAGSANYFLSST